MYMSTSKDKVNDMNICVIGGNSFKVHHYWHNEILNSVQIRASSNLGPQCIYSKISNWIGEKCRKYLTIPFKLQIFEGRKSRYIFVFLFYNVFVLKKKIFRYPFRAQTIFAKFHKEMTLFLYTVPLVFSLSLVSSRMSIKCGGFVKCTHRFNFHTCCKLAIFL